MNGIAKMISYIGWAIICIGIFLFLYLLFEIKDIWYGVGVIITSIIFGTLFVGISEIIQLLQEILNTNKNGSKV